MRIEPLQALERAARAVLVQALALLLPVPRARAVPDWDARPYRVLFLRYNRIGDMIMSTGVIRAIARSHPTITVDVLASPANASVVERDPDVRAVVPFARGRFRGYPALLRRLRAARYDVVVDGMAATPKPVTALLMLAAGAAYRVGFAAPEAGRLYTLPVGPAVRGVHHIDQLVALASPFGAARTTDWRPAIVLTGDERRRAEEEWARVVSGNGTTRRLLVNISAGQPRRRWPDDRFIAVIRHLRSRDPTVRVAVIGTPDEGASVEHVARESGAVAMRTATVRDALALVATADLVFTPDTSISHAASAFAKPSVVMLTRDIASFVPYRTAGRNVFADAGPMRSIPVERVTAAWDELLSELAPDCGESPG